MEMIRVPSSRGAWAITNQPASQQPQRDEPSFPTIEAVIFERDARPGKHQLGILETEAMLCEVLPLLRIVPFVLQPSV